MRTILLIAWVWPTLVLAQSAPADTLPKPTRQFMTRPVSSISLGLGISQSAFRNDEESVLIRTGFGVPVGLTYRREGLRTRQYVGIDYLSHNLRSRFGNTTAEVRGSLSYTYLRRVQSGQRLTLYAGGGVETQASIQTGVSGSGNNTGSLINALSVSGMSDYRLGKHGFEAQASIVLLGYAIRPGNPLFTGGKEPKFGDVINALNAEIIPNFVGGAWRVAYFPPAVSRRWFWRIDYRGQLQRFSQGTALGFAQQQLTASIVYQTGKRP